MIKHPLLTALFLAAAWTPLACSAEDVLLKEDFQKVVQAGPTGAPWKPGETFPGFYAVLGAIEPDGAPGNLLQNPNGERGRANALYLFEKDDHKSLGFAVGASTGTCMIALRLENRSNQTIKKIEIAFDLHQWVATPVKPKTVGLSFTEGDPVTMEAADVSHFLGSKEEAVRWIDIPDGAVVTSLGEGDGPIDPLKEGLFNKSAKQVLLDWKPNTALWIKWNFSGPPYAKMSLSNVRISATGAQ